MGLRPLGAKWMRRIARNTGLEIVWASGNGGYTMFFTTADHRHGWYDKKTDTWGWDPNFGHATSCARLFPDWNNNSGVRT